MSLAEYTYLTSRHLRLLPSPLRENSMLAHSLSASAARRLRLLPSPHLRRALSALSAPRPPAAAAPSPTNAANAQSIPLLPGEVLLSASSHTNNTAALRSWMSCIAPLAYISTVKGIDAYQAMEGGLPLLSFNWTCVMAALALGTTLFSRGTLRSMVRALVLTADGQSVRVYPFSLVPFHVRGLGAPVTIPVRLLRENADFGASKKKAAEADDCVYVRVRQGGARGEAWSSSHLCVEKPPRSALDLPAARGSGLTFTPRGLAPSSTPVDFTPGGGAARGGLPLARSDMAAFREYAVLAWVLKGNPVVNMARLRAGDWELEAMAAQLGGGDRALLHAVDMGKWREAVDAASGRSYFWCAETWDTRAEPPPGWREWRAGVDKGAAAAAAAGSE